MHDWRGVSLGALSTHTSLASSVADMEALACLRAVQYAAELELELHPLLAVMFGRMLCLWTLLL